MAVTAIGSAMVLAVASLVEVVGRVAVAVVLAVASLVEVVGRVAVAAVVAVLAAAAEAVVA